MVMGLDDDEEKKLKEIITMWNRKTRLELIELCGFERIFIFLLASSASFFRFYQLHTFSIQLVIAQENKN